MHEGSKSTSAESSPCSYGDCPPQRDLSKVLCGSVSRSWIPIRVKLLPPRGRLIHTHRALLEPPEGDVLLLPALLDSMRCCLLIVEPAGRSSETAGFSSSSGAAGEALTDDTKCASTWPITYANQAARQLFLPCPAATSTGGGGRATAAGPSGEARGHDESSSSLRSDCLVGSCLSNILMPSEQTDSVMMVCC